MSVSPVKHTHTCTRHLEGRDDELEAVRVGAPRVRDVLERDEVGAREDDSVRPEGVDRLLARQVRLKGERVYNSIF